MSLVNPLSRNAPQCALLIFFTFLTPDDFTRQRGSSAQLNGLNLTMSLVNPLSRNAPQCAWPTFFFTCLMPDIFTCLTADDFTCQWGSSAQLNGLNLTMSLVNPLSRNAPQCARPTLFFTCLTPDFFTCLKADFQSSHEAPRSSLRVMHEHFHPITMLNSSF